MPKIAYIEKRFQQSSLDLINLIDKIVREYSGMGYTLTLRQIYYQLVARGHIPNNERSYKNTGSIINDGRLAGLIDWSAVEDRTRNLRSLSHWDGPQEILYSAAASYRMDHWRDQGVHVECMCEKDALISIVGKACDKLDIPYFSCRGYVSQSEMWSMAMRLIDHHNSGEDIVLLHLGDHDPSGIDMSRDIQNRLNMFGLEGFEFKRLALNWDQIEEFNPPPNPTKLTDSRANSYIDEYGMECWELDALEPYVITKLINEAVEPYIDKDMRDEVLMEERSGRLKMQQLADKWEHLETRWGEIEDLLNS